VFQPEPEPAPVEPPSPFSGQTLQVGRTFDTNGNTLISEATLRSEEVATGEYVRLAAEQRWLESHRPSLVSEYMAACDLILEALAHAHGTTPETERERLGRHVDARFRRDYG
jgi:hypothetical protein